MRHLAVIGDPISHSLSPILHNHIMSTVGIAGNYSRIRVQSQADLEKVIDSLRSGDLHGISITAPWKSDIAAYMDEITPEARKIGAINTVKSSNDSLIGHNTDKAGFTRSLRQLLEKNRLSAVAVLGAGGAARAVLAGLHEFEPDHIVILNRTLKNAEILAEYIGDKLSIDTESLNKDTLTKTLKEFDLVINTLPPQGRELFGEKKVIPNVSEKSFYYDLVYASRYKSVIENFADAGWRSKGGLDMLILQGIAAMEFWLDRSIEDQLDIKTIREVMRKEEAENES